MVLTAELIKKQLAHYAIIALSIILLKDYIITWLLPYLTWIGSWAGNVALFIALFVIIAVVDWISHKLLGI